MTPQPLPWVKAGLSGRPVIEEGKELVDVAACRVIRGRDGRPIYFTDTLACKYVADMSGEFIGRTIRRVFFLKKNRDRQQQFALMSPVEPPLSKAELLVIEVFFWLRRRDAGRAKKKLIQSTTE